MWEQFCELVYNDRSRNAEAAELARLQGHGVGSAVDEVDVEEEPKSLVNKKYFQPSSKHAFIMTLKLTFNVPFKHTFNVPIKYTFEVPFKLTFKTQF